jgi:seryl-tRNA(Sec) selenium transferase
MSVSQGVVAAMRAAGSEFVNLEELQRAISKRLAPYFGGKCVRVVSGCHAGLLLVCSVFLKGTDIYALSTLPESAKEQKICLLPEETEVPAFPITLTGCQIERKKPDEEALLVVSQQQFTAELQHKKLAVFCNAPLLPEKITELCRASDAVIFDGSIFGAPGQTAIVVSKEEIEAGLCQITAPKHGIGRSFKTGKEEIAGAYAAVLEYFGGESE